MTRHMPMIVRGVAATVLSAAPILAQLSDLQPGRNFPTASGAFGGNRSEDIAFGDVDNDGDLDVVVANGGDFGNEANRIFINNGGLQGGTTGTFTQETNTRFAGIPNDTSRDIDFADIDADGDLDILVANRGGNVVGQASRFYVNQGGLQGGTVGFFVEDTNNRWGTLVSVPAGDQILGGNQGPFEDWSCDCEFGDLDGDEDLDLFFSSYGPSMNGNRDSRVFLNDGTGVFDELFPWIDAGADIRTHAMDVELVDLDGDFDLDVVVASRDSQARIYNNNTENPLPGSTRRFTDTTQVSLINTGAAMSGSSNYGVEAIDADGDDDFDLWMVNYQGFTEKLLENVGTGSQGTLFAEISSPFKGDPNQDEEAIEPIDFDGDGDLDMLAPNFSGTNWLWASGHAQGGSLGSGMYHRTGTSAGGSQYPVPETPSSNNGGTTLSGATGDLDGDGDVDVALANDANQQNRVWFNALGIPDTHPPRPIGGGPIANPTGVDCEVKLLITDSTGLQGLEQFDVKLLYSIDFGPTQVEPMDYRGGGIFSGRITSGAVFPCVSWRVEARDLAQNTYTTESEYHGDECWENLGCELPGIAGPPQLVGSGSLTAGSLNALALSQAAPVSTSGLFVSLVGAALPFKGGTLKLLPTFAPIVLPTSGAGAWSVPFVTPPGLAGVDVFLQVAIVDAAAVQGFALSNALRAPFK